MVATDFSLKSTFYCTSKMFEVTLKGLSPVAFVATKEVWLRAPCLKLLEKCRHILKRLEQNSFVRIVIRILTPDFLPSSLPLLIFG